MQKPIYKNVRKHTPEPWKIVEQDIIGNEQNGYICTWSGRRANAYLIAAAPELLKACKAAKKYLEPHLLEPGRTIFWNLVTAIAKAELKPKRTNLNNN
jgi:hypothetical protein